MIMNWGWKIVVVYGAFVVMTLGMVFYFMGHKVDLVAEDYYKQEIEYQDQIDKISNARMLKEPISFEYNASERKVKLTFPSEHLDNSLVGTIHFYRPSDSDLDKKFRINPTESGDQTLSVGSLNKGLWKVKISWTTADKAYYDEKTLIL